MNEQLLEIWKPIKGYEGLYEVSNFGRVMSLPKRWGGKTGNQFHDGKILEPGRGEYFRITLCKSNKKNSVNIHQIAWVAFNGEFDTKKYEIDHIDNDKHNPRLDNLQLLTKRANNIKRIKASGKTLPVGVSKRDNKYVARITTNQTTIHLGSFATAIQAQLAYQKKLIQIGEFPQ